MKKWFFNLLLKLNLIETRDLVVTINFTKNGEEALELARKRLGIGPEKEVVHLAICLLERCAEGISKGQSVYLINPESGHRIKLLLNSKSIPSDGKYTIH